MSTTAMVQFLLQTQPFNLYTIGDTYEWGFGAS